MSYFLKDLNSSIKQKETQQDKSLDGIKSEFSKLKEELPAKYVMKEDFNRVLHELKEDQARNLKELKDDQTRAIAGVEHKVDTLTRDVRDMLQLVSKLTGAGGKSE
ncbi:hypothetical protein H7C19_20180 [Cohnella nanjingensis]|uniref:Uncharacterized protein n=1 Tax=Cohnella nanjingensis TaxID=1387779 RepID=A0A7X0RT24_9BACL|nr:hypothetical protein [Cohnella nanjingensis]